MDNKNIKSEKIFNSIGMIIFFWILYIIFSVCINRTLNAIVKLNKFENIFYASLVQLAILILFFRFSKSREHEIKNEKVKKIDLLDIFIFGAAGILFSMVIVLIMSNVKDLLNFGYLQSYKNSYKEFLGDFKISTMDQVYNVFSSILIIPAVEEFFYRKGIFRFLENKNFSKKNIIIISSFAFGLMHLSGIAPVVNAILIGLVLSIVFSITEDIKYPIIINGFNNLSNYASSIVYGLYFENTPDIEFMIRYGKNINTISSMVFILIVLVVLSIISYRKKGTILSIEFRSRLKNT